MKRILTEKEVKNICQEYVGGKSINYLTKMNHLQKWQIKNILLKNNIKVLTAYETKIKYSKQINLDCLDGNNELSAYVLGLIFGDGHVNFDKEKYKYSTSLVSIDYDIVKSAQTLFGEHFPIQTLNPKNNKKQITYNIVVNSKEFSIYLRERFKLVNQKSNCLIFPELPNDMYQFFISGLLSTDGCIRIDKRRGNQTCGLEFSYSSNCLDFIEKLQKYLIKQLNITQTKIKNNISGRKNINYNLRYTGSQATLILNWIYKNTNEQTRCKRKFDIYQNYLTSLTSQIQ